MQRDYLAEWTPNSDFLPKTRESATGVAQHFHGAALNNELLGHLFKVYAAI